MIYVKDDDEVKTVLEHLARKEFSSNSMLVKKAVAELTTTRGIDWKEEEISDK